MSNLKLKRKIYICDAGNDEYGINFIHKLYMTSEQVDENRGKIRRDRDGDPFIYVGELSRDDYFDAAKMRRIARAFEVNDNVLWERIDGQDPETLAEELSENQWDF